MPIAMTPSQMAGARAVVVARRRRAPAAADPGAPISTAARRAGVGGPALGRSPRPAAPAGRSRASPARRRTSGGRARSPVPSSNGRAEHPEVGVAADRDRPAAVDDAAERARRRRRSGVSRQPGGRLGEAEHRHLRRGSRPAPGSCRHVALGGDADRELDRLAGRHRAGQHLDVGDAPRRRRPARPRPRARRSAPSRAHAVAEGVEHGDVD